MTDRMDELQVTVQVTDREDGGIRVLSSDIPGMLLGGLDHQRTWSSVGLVVEHAMRHRGVDVREVIGPMVVPDQRGDVVLIVRHAPAQARAAA
jgi:hypothetical protein